MMYMNLPDASKGKFAMNHKPYVFIFLTMLLIACSSSTTSKIIFRDNFNGELVNEIISDEGNESSTVVWNGNNFKGEFVGSGVYFFTGTDSNGHVFREKMVVIRR